MADFAVPAAEKQLTIPNDNLCNGCARPTTSPLPTLMTSIDLLRALLLPIIFVAGRYRSRFGGAAGFVADYIHFVAALSTLIASLLGCMAWLPVRKLLPVCPARVEVGAPGRIPYGAQDLAVMLDGGFRCANLQQ
jgi:hypothetical protein